MEILKNIAELSESGKPFVLITVIKASGSSPAKPGFRLAVSGEKKLYGTIGGGILEKTLIDEAFSILDGTGGTFSPGLHSINLKQIGMQCGGAVELFIEHFTGVKTFILFGGGHLGRAMTPVLELLGYKVIIFDNRDEVRSMIKGANARIIIGDYNNISEISGELKNSSGCFLATHGHEWDLTVLRQVSETTPNLPYIGMIGSAMKVKNILDKLHAEGIELPPNLYTPVGLEIGGDTPAEIAISIAAEIIAVGNRKKVPHMQNRRLNLENS